jgi:multidrug efflux pump subunit AcrA (membrane-fusion protein)
MSTPENFVDNAAPDDTDLDAFNDLLHGKTKPEAPKDDDPVPSDENDENYAPIEQEETQDEEDADLAKDDDEDKDEDEKPKPKSRTEKRIEKLLEEARLARERAEKAEALLAKQEAEKAPVTPKPKDVSTDKAPHPDDKNEDGTDKYPLGQFDEAFQEDRFNYMMEKSLAEQRAALEQQAREQEVKRAQEALVASWNEKLEPVKEKYTDFVEKGEELLDTFSDLDQQYGEYLTTTIMGMDHGPEVLYYLSNNIAEANRIVKLGPLGATIALGRIEAQFAYGDDEDKKSTPRPKVSKAPPVPPRNKGSHIATPEVPDDTDDLDAFAQKLFKKG